MASTTSDGILYPFKRHSKASMWYVKISVRLNHYAKKDTLNDFFPLPSINISAGWANTPVSSNSWVHGLAQLLEEQKLQVEVKEQYENPDYYLPIMAQSHLAGLDEYIYQKKEDNAIEKFQEQLAAEFKAGTFVDISYIYVVARKPEVSNGFLLQGHRLLGRSSSAALPIEFFQHASKSLLCYITTSLIYLKRIQSEILDTIINNDNGKWENVPATQYVVV
ncbi:hypothetical protein AJ78_00271 [Emergomyces pasteurianus Ep9510]|uniref:Uncharacterized protein n=1 Tax=Emergomyces pasteurianus Ep9510 TaxID=1447872 RepID=A0A1J9QV88_9EURO|nr:hypothetical protein AJ78_00271 [Emergomyces pasteurianus Ep9510]